MEKKIRIGFLVFDFMIPAWYHETISQVDKKGYSICFILANKVAGHGRNKPALFQLFQRFEERWFHSSYDASQLASIEEFVSRHASIKITGQTDVFSDEDLSTVQDLELHVIYSIDDYSINITQLSNVATYGLWRIQFGHQQYRNNGLPAFWEVMHDVAVTGSSLVIYKNSKAQVAYEGTTRTIPYSAKNNFNSIAWKSSSYLCFRLYSLEQLGNAFLQSLPFCSKEPTKAGAFPGNFLMGFLFIRNIFRYLHYKLQSKLTKDRFTVLYATGSFSLASIDSIKFQPVPLPNKDVFFADPFVVEKDGLNYIFFEEMVYSLGKAHISVMTVSSENAISQPTKVLDKPYHLSYPYIFEHDGDYYMIPETASNNTVELYKASAFPHQWEFVMNLMSGVMLFDATIHYCHNKWWLFATSASHAFSSTNDQLFLYYSNELFSTEWLPHPLNPIATHAGNCRPAGRIFKADGHLYRPAQNNASQQYGHGLVLNQIEALNEYEYRERQVYFLNNRQHRLKACHHIDFSSSLTVIDGIVD